MTRSKTSKENEKIGSRNKSLETDFEDKIDDKSEDTGKDNVCCNVYSCSTYFLFISN